MTVSKGSSSTKVQQANLLPLFQNGATKSLQSITRRLWLTFYPCTKVRVNEASELVPSSWSTSDANDDRTLLISSLEIQRVGNVNQVCDIRKNGIATWYSLMRLKFFVEFHIQRNGSGTYVLLSEGCNIKAGNIKAGNIKAGNIKACTAFDICFKYGLVVCCLSIFHLFRTRPQSLTKILSIIQLLQYIYSFIIRLQKVNKLLESLPSQCESPHPCTVFALALLIQPCLVSPVIVGLVTAATTMDTTINAGGG